jgi:hypothetical protein
MPTLAMAYDIAARDSASPVFAKVGSEAAKTAKSVEQAAAAMQKAANAEVDAAARFVLLRRVLMMCGSRAAPTLATCGG